LPRRVIAAAGARGEDSQFGRTNLRARDIQVRLRGIQNDPRFVALLHQEYRSALHLADGGHQLPVFQGYKRR